MKTYTIEVTQQLTRKTEIKIDATCFEEARNKIKGLSSEEIEEIEWSETRGSELQVNLKRFGMF